MQTTVAAHAPTAIILSTIITTSHHHISASYIVTDRLSPRDAACPGTSYNIYNCEWIKIYTSGVFCHFGDDRRLRHCEPQDGSTMLTDPAS